MFFSQTNFLMCSITSLPQSIPQRILDEAFAYNNRVDYGYLNFFDLYYCFWSNKLYLWDPVSNKITNELLEESYENEILCLSEYHYFLVESGAYATCMAVITENYVAFYGADQKNKSVNFKERIDIFPVDFFTTVATELCNGVLLLGTSLGYVYYVYRDNGFVKKEIFSSRGILFRLKRYLTKKHDVIDIIKSKNMNNFFTDRFFCIRLSDNILHVFMLGKHSYDVVYVTTINSYDVGGCNICGASIYRTILCDGTTDFICLFLSDGSSVYTLRRDLYNAKFGVLRKVEFDFDASTSLNVVYATSFMNYLCFVTYDNFFYLCDGFIDFISYDASMKPPLLRKMFEIKSESYLYADFHNGNYIGFNLADKDASLVTFNPVQLRIISGSFSVNIPVFEDSNPLKMNDWAVIYKCIFANYIGSRIFLIDQDFNYSVNPLFSALPEYVSIAISTVLDSSKGEILDDNSSKELHLINQMLLKVQRILTHERFHDMYVAFIKDDRFSVFRSLFLRLAGFCFPIHSDKDEFSNLLLCLADIESLLEHNSEKATLYDLMIELSTDVNFPEDTKCYIMPLLNSILQMKHDIMNQVESAYMNDVREHIDKVIKPYSELVFMALKSDYVQYALYFLESLFNLYQGDERSSIYDEFIDHFFEDIFSRIDFDYIIVNLKQFIPYLTRQNSIIYKSFYTHVKNKEITALQKKLLRMPTNVTDFSINAYKQQMSDLTFRDVFNILLFSRDSDSNKVSILSEFITTGKEIDIVLAKILLTYLDSTIVDIQQKSKIRKFYTSLL